jgi:ornithine lipid ester-linked acyl 2-hydroxylase
MKRLKAWYSFSGNGTYPYKAEDHFFFDLEDHPSVKLLLENARVMRDELALLKERNDPSIVPYFNRKLADKPENWTIFPFFMWGYKFRKNASKAPKTTKLLHKIPGLLSATFSILKPQSSIPTHVGDSNVMYRCHIPLLIPQDASESYLQVGEERRSWKLGECLAFCDAQRHSAKNGASDERWVLIVDIIRPEFSGRKNWICAKVFASLLFQFAFQRTGLLSKFPGPVRSAMMLVGGVFCYPYLFFRKVIVR